MSEAVDSLQHPCPGSTLLRVGYANFAASNPRMATAVTTSPTVPCLRATAIASVASSWTMCSATPSTVPSSRAARTIRVAPSCRRRSASQRAHASCPNRAERKRSAACRKSRLRHFNNPIDFIWNRLAPEFVGHHSSCPVHVLSYMLHPEEKYISRPSIAGTERPSVRTVADNAWHRGYSIGVLGHQVGVFTKERCVCSWPATDVGVRFLRDCVGMDA